MANKSPAKRKPFYEQNDRFLPIDPPNYLGTVARSVWTKIIPYLKATEKVLSYITRNFSQFFIGCIYQFMLMFANIFRYNRIT